MAKSKNKNGYRSKGRYSDFSGNKNYNQKKKDDVPMVAVGQGKTWFFRNKKEAARIMGTSVQQISSEMKNNGRNASNLKWYTEDFYKKRIKDKDKKKKKVEENPKEKPTVDEFGYKIDEWGIKRDKLGNKVPDIDPVKDRFEIDGALKALERMQKNAERTIRRRELRRSEGKAKSERGQKPRKK